MPVKQAQTPYPLIDADPHAGRVIRYMRPSDYAAWAGAAAAGPAALYAFGESVVTVWEWWCLEGVFRGKEAGVRMEDREVESECLGIGLHFSFL